MTRWIGLAASLLALGGCCLSTISGSTGDFGGSNGSAGGIGGVATSGGSTAGATTSGGSTNGTTTGAAFVGTGGACGPASNLSDATSYTSLAFDQIVTGDLNGDGLLDLIATTKGGPLQVFFGQPDGGLSAPVQYPGAEGNTIAVGDVNGDGHPDVVVSIAPYLLILVNDGSGALTQLPPAIDINDTWATEIAVADINADGLADLLVGEGENTTPSPEVQIVLLLGQDGGTFSPPRVIPGIGGGGLPDFLVTDLNQDGLPDIVADTSDGFDLAVMLNHGDGGFDTHLYPAPAALQIVSVPSAGKAPDLAFASTTASGVQVLKNSGHGTFSMGPTYLGPDGGHPGSAGGYLTIGDFNGDCIPDIATMACTSSMCDPGSGDVLFILYGDDAGGFEPASLPPPGTTPDGFLAVLGQVDSPRALAIANAVGGGLCVYGDASKR